MCVSVCGGGGLGVCVFLVCRIDSSSRHVHHQNSILF